MTLAHKISVYSGQWNTMNLDATQKQLDDFHSGGQLVQEAFPNMPPEQREFLISGMSIEEQTSHFEPDSRSSKGFHAKGGEYYHIGDF